jgi:hypothetical protein
MKNLILVLIVLFGITLNSSAQIQKGAMLIGGNVSFNVQEINHEFWPMSKILDNNSDKITFFSATPQYGIFINESTLIGMGIFYEYSKNEEKYIDPISFGEEEDIYKSNLVFINPHIKKIFKVKENFFVTTNLNFLIGFGKIKIESHYWPDKGEIEINLFEYRLNVSPGLTYFLNEKWALNANIGQLFYSHQKETPDNYTGFSEQPKNIHKDFGLSFKFNTFSIGIQYYLRNNSK